VRGGKTFNEYAATLGAMYADTPKAVFAAIAVSALTSGGDQLKQGKYRIAQEWRTLHDNGIVPQPLPHAFEELADFADVADGLTRASGGGK